jgi:hypothetical protein
MNTYTNIEIKEFLKKWGTAFKELDFQKFPDALGYYQACIDAHQYLDRKPFVFYDKAGLRRTLCHIADLYDIEFKRGRGTSYQGRAQLMRHIANYLLNQPVKNEVGVQTSMF